MAIPVKVQKALDEVSVSNHVNDAECLINDAIQSACEDAGLEDVDVESIIDSISSDVTGAIEEAINNALEEVKTDLG